MFRGSAKDRGLLEDERALQLALDQLCLLGLGEPPAPTAGEDGGGGGGGAPAQPAAPPQPAPPPPPAAAPAAPSAAPAAQTPQPPTAPKGANDAKLCALYKEAELRLKGSSNTTECVPVPTSEHVAEIVGRQGKRASRHREGWSGGLAVPGAESSPLPSLPASGSVPSRQRGPRPLPRFQVPQKFPATPGRDGSRDPSSPGAPPVDKEISWNWERKGEGSCLLIPGSVRRGCRLPAGRTDGMCNYLEVSTLVSAWRLGRGHSWDLLPLELGTRRETRSVKPEGGSVSLLG